MAMKVPFLDLSREIIHIKDVVTNKMNTIIFDQTNFILGKELETFETNFADYITQKHCIGVGNGTDALEIAVQSLGLNEYDEIITQSNTYVATCFGVTNNHKRLKLVDIDPETYQMDLDKLEASITDKTRVVIVVHLTGSCCNMDRLMDIVNKHNITLIEDCAQSHGAYFKNKRLGSYGLLSTFSFYPGKNLGAFGDGGAICTSDEEICETIRKIRNNGSIEKYKHDIFGRNSRLDTLQAAILDIKLGRLDSNNEKRREHALSYKSLLADVGDIRLPEIVENCVPVYHLFMIRTDKRDELRTYLEKYQIGVGIHYPICISKLACYKDYFDSHHANAEKNSSTILSLPMFPDITNEEITHVCKKIKDFYSL